MKKLITSLKGLIKPSVMTIDPEQNSTLLSCLAHIN
jgi:hypothetical protein